jgi:hypothetical protein
VGGLGGGAGAGGELWSGSGGNVDEGFSEKDLRKAMLLSVEATASGSRSRADFGCGAGAGAGGARWSHPSTAVIDLVSDSDEEGKSQEPKANHPGQSWGSSGSRSSAGFGGAVGFFGGGAAAAPPAFQPGLLSAAIVRSAYDISTATAAGLLEGNSHVMFDVKVVLHRSLSAELRDGYRMIIMLFSAIPICSRVRLSFKIS